MGHDIRAIVNHDLNTSSIEALAKDLSDRFNRTVQYGYFDGAFVKGFTEGSDKQVISGTIQKESEQVWLLNDLVYTDRFLKPLEYEGIVVYEFYDIKDTECEGYMDIMKHCLEPNISYDPRWNGFVEHFIGAYSNWGDVNEYRKKIRDLGKILGGDRAIYYDDCGPSSAASTMADKECFDFIHEKMKSRFGVGYINIS